MMYAKLFENGRSQAVRLPKEYRFDGNEVGINKIGEIVILIPKKNKWASFMEATQLFSDDLFENGRELPKEQKREKL